MFEMEIIRRLQPPSCSLRPPLTEDTVIHCLDSSQPQICFRDKTRLVMAGNSYRGFVRILEKWPVDKNKQGKDIGEGLRQLFSKNFPSGSSTPVNEALMSRSVSFSRVLISSDTLTLQTSGGPRESHSEQTQYLVSFTVKRLLHR